MRHPRSTRSHSLPLLLAAAALAFVPPASAFADVKTISKHATLGFKVSGAMPDDVSKSDSIECVDPCFLGVLPCCVTDCDDICNAFYQVDLSDIEAGVAVSLGGDFDLSYDRANIRAGATVPITIVYTPSNDAGEEFNLSVEGSVTAGFEMIIPPEGCVVLPQDIAFSGKASDLTAPLSTDGAMVIPVSSDEVLAACLGLLPGVFTLKVEGNLTLTPVPSFDSTTLVPAPPNPLPLIGGTILPAVGGGTGTFALPDDFLLEITNPNAIGTLVVGLPDFTAVANNLFPIEWQVSGESKTRTVVLKTPLPAGAILHTELGSIMHWLNIAADLDLTIGLPVIGGIVSVGILDSGDIKDIIDDRKCQGGADDGDPCEMNSDCDSGDCGGDLGQKVGEMVSEMVQGTLCGAGDVAAVAAAREDMACSGGANNGKCCATDDNCPGGTCADMGAMDGLPTFYGQAFRDRVNNLNFPLPFFDPPLPEIGDPENLPAFGKLLFDIPTDSDGDGLADGDEIAGGTDPDDPDSDDDGLDDGDEVAAGTDPLDPDSDDDTLDDNCEVHGSNPTNPLDKDTDHDGLDDNQEDANGNCARDAGETDPNDADSDDDNLTDGCEVNGTNPTDPLNKDSDGDGLLDGEEDTNRNCSLDLGESNPNSKPAPAPALSLPLLLVGLVLLGAVARRALLRLRLR